MKLRQRTVASVSLIAGTLLALSACTSTGATNPKPVEHVSTATSVATSTPSRTTAPSFPLAPAPARAASTASIRAAFGSECASDRSKMPATKYQASIGDVDGDGRKDIEWATIPTSGAIEFGVTTASGTTVAKTVGFASGGQRSVSIGTLATGQTVALPTDQHGALLYVIHDCKWVEPRFASKQDGTDFITGYYDPPEDGGGCVGRRLYQVESTQPSKDQETVTGIAEHISSDGRTITAGTQVTFLTNEDVNTSPNTVRNYGYGQCSPSPRLLPTYAS